MVYSKLAKIVVVGEANSGKTSLIRRLIHDDFVEENNMTIGVDFHATTLPVQYPAPSMGPSIQGSVRQGETVQVKLQIWDTAGQERFNSIVTQFFRNLDGAVVVYDANNPLSYQRAVEFWIPRVKATDSSLPIILVGNKSELTSSFNPEAKETASKEGILFKSASAKDNINVKGIFEDLALSIVEHVGLEGLEKSVSYETNFPETRYFVPNLTQLYWPKIPVKRCC